MTLSSSTTTPAATTVPETASEGAPAAAAALAPVALFVLVHAAFVAGSMALVRRNLDGGLASIGVGMLHLGALAGAVLLAGRIADRRGVSLPAAIAVGALLAYLLPLFGHALGPLALILPGLLTIAGLFLAIDLSRRESAAIVAVSVLGGLFSGGWLFLWLNAEIYAHVLSYEFVLLGWQSVDPTFHSAIAALFNTYGTFTNGVNGTTLLPYHVFSHGVAAGLARESGEVLPLVYPAFQQIFIIPGLLFGTSVAAVLLSGRLARQSVLAPLVVLLFWIGYEWIGAYNTFLLSDSYAYSLGLLSFGTALAVQGPRPKAAMRWFVLAGLISLASVLSKFTMALAWTLLLSHGLWHWLRNRSMALRTVAALVLLAGFIVLVVLLLLSVDVQNTFEWFGYFNHMRRYFLGSAAMSGIGVAAALIGQMLGLPTPRWYLIVILFLALHLPDSLVFAWSAEYYWFHPADQIALFVAAAVAITLLPTGGTPRSGIVALSALALVGVTTALLLTSTFFSQSVSTVAKTFRAFEQLERVETLPDIDSLPPGTRSHGMARALLAVEGSAQDTEPSGISEDLLMIARTVVSGLPAGADTRVAETPLARAVDAIDRERSGGPADQKGLFIPPSASWYWNGQSECLSRPFAIQAVTGLAMIAGRPRATDRCPDNIFYGLALSEAARNRDLSDPELCSIATASGLTRILVLAEPEAVRTVLCQ